MDCGICMASCPFSQGINKETISKMKDNLDMMRTVIEEHKEKYGKRNYIKEQLNISKIE